jgi:hypothetical protein
MDACPVCGSDKVRGQACIATRLFSSGQSHALVTGESAGLRWLSLTLRFSKHVALHHASTVLHHVPVPNIFHIPQKTKAALRRAASPKFPDNLCCALSTVITLYSLPRTCPWRKSCRWGLGQRPFHSWSWLYPRWWFEWLSRRWNSCGRQHLYLYLDCQR